MKGRKKQGKSSETAGEQLGKMKRKDFLKALGVGVGAVGVTSVMGRTGLAAIEDADRSKLQGFIRTLIEDPDLAADFMKDPQKVAEDKGIRLSEADLKKLEESIERLRDQEAVKPGVDVGRDYSVSTPPPGVDVGRDYSVSTPPVHVVGTRPGPEQVINPADEPVRQPTTPEPEQIINPADRPVRQRTTPEPERIINPADGPVRQRRR
jgi:hypothetical protein